MFVCRVILVPHSVTALREEILLKDNSTPETHYQSDHRPTDRPSKTEYYSEQPRYSVRVPGAYNSPWKSSSSAASSHGKFLLMTTD